MTARHHRARLARQFLGVIACISILAFAGSGRLGAPPLLHPAYLMRWWSSQGPVTGAVSLARVGGLVAGGYFLILCGLTVVARITGRAVWLTRLRLPGLGRLLLRKAAGASVISAAMAGAAGCGVVAGGHPAGHPVAVHPAAGHPAAGGVPTPPVLVPVDPAPVTVAPVPATPASGPTAGGPSMPTTGPPRVEPATPTPTTWVVRPGDDLWAISASVLESRLGHVPDDRAVAALWLQVIELNRPRLPDPSNPGLIFAGEVVAIPG